MKIRFTLDAWLKDTSQKVVDEDDRPVRIICTDADGLYPIIGLVDNKTPLPCGKNGRPPYIGGGGGTLFIVIPEPELSEFEKELSKCLCDASCRPEPENYDAWAKQYAPKLLELAKKELQEKVIHDYWKQAADRCAQAKEEGKAEALKDLPRWHDIRNFVYSRTSEDKTFYDDTLGQLFHKGKKLFIGDLEKLPGFNE